MSPLLGSYGGSSEYAFRGTIDDWPNDFSFDNQVEVDPGEVYTSNSQTITGINNRAIVRVSAGASVSINGGSYVIPTEGSPVFIQNNQTITVRIPTTSGSTSDFNKTYSATVSVGKKSANWSITTKFIDSDPTPVTFTNLTGKEIGVAYTSNEVVVSGLQTGFSFPASIISGSGSLVVNGGSPVSSSNVTNGDRIYLRIVSPSEYTNYPSGSGTKTVSTVIQIANYSTSWSVSSREVDIFINAFDFEDVNNANIESVYTKQSINSSGVVTTITGADTGIPLLAAITDCELRVEQPTAGDVFSIRRDFSPQNATVFNGDRLTARVTTGSEYSKTKIGIVTVSNHTAQFITTTRPRPVDTIPDPLSGLFTDLTNQQRNVVIESNEVTLTGMSGSGDQGVASISTGSDGGNGQFKVTRGTTVVRDYGITTSYVQQGDKIRLRLTSSPNSNVTRSATFSIQGVDTSLNLNGITGTQQDVWNVVTATRQCSVTAFSFNTVEDADPNKLYSTTFVAQGFDSDCGMVVSTSNSNSYLSVSGSALTNNIPISPGTTVTVYMTSGDYFATRSTNVIVSNSSNSVSPAGSRTVTWTINTVDDTRNTTLSMTSDKSSIQLGQTVKLTWNSVNAASINTFGGSGFSPTTTSGTADVTPTVTGTIRYTLTVLGPPSAANYATQIAATPQGVTAYVDVTVTEDTTPDTFSMSPSSLSDQALGSYSSFTAQSSTDSGVSVSGISPGLTITASSSSTTGSDTYFTVNGSGRFTSASVKNGDVLVLYLQNSNDYLITSRAALTIGSNSQSVSSTSSPCRPPTSTTNITSGVDVNTIAVKGTYENGQSFSYQAYSSSSGSNIDQKSKSDFSISFSQIYQSTSTRTITEESVTSAFIAAIGGGGGGGGAPASNFAGGGGGAASAYRRISVAPGGRFGWSAGRGGAGGTSGNAGADGGSSTVTYTGSPSPASVSAGGGRGGPAGSGGGAGGTSSSENANSGGAGQGRQPAAGHGGRGGGAGLLGGTTTAAPGANKTSGCGDSAAGGAGGGGAQIPINVPGPEDIGIDATCDNVGRNGRQLGGGGGGGAKGSSGGSGGDGGVRIQYSGTIVAPTWRELITQIVNVYKSNLNRPPSGQEIKDAVATFTANASLSLSTFSSNLSTQLSGSSTKASSITDSCGNAI